MKNLVKDCKIRTFKVIYQWLKLVESFQKIFCDKYLTRRPFLLMKFLKTLIFKVLIFLKMCPIFVGSVHNFDKSDNDKI